MNAHPLRLGTALLAIPFALVAQEHAWAEIPLGPPLSLPDGHEGPSLFDAATGHFYFTRASADFSSARVMVLAPGEMVPTAAAFSTGPYDAGLTRSPSGDMFIFTSKRATAQNALPDEWNLWSVAAGASAGADPSPLPEPVNSSAAECCAAFAPDGTFLFSSDRRGSWDIYRASPVGGGSWTVRALEGTLNSEGDEWPSWVSTDGGLVLFSSTRPGGFGGDDLFAACRMPGADRWEAIRLSAAVNTAGYEDSGMLTPDGRTFYWSGRRPDPRGSAEILRLPMEDVGLPACR